MSASERSTLPIGTQAEAAFTVQDGDTARALSIAPGDDFPPVFATSRMIALMELAAARAMRPLLRPGELSVGVEISVRHTAATPVGGAVRAVATYLGQDGKMHRFKLEAFDDAGAVGEGTHLRAIVNTDRIVAGAERRMTGN